MNGWHYASADLRIVHYFKRGSALCNGRSVPGKFVGVRPPEDACHRCLWKMNPGWRKARRGTFNHFFERGRVECNSPQTRISGPASPNRKHCSKCSELLMRRIRIRPAGAPVTEPASLAAGGVI